MRNDSAGQPTGVDFAQFYRDRWTQLRASFAWASSLGIDPDDVTQDTMVRARKHHQRFASDVELMLWCRRVGTNIIKRQARTAYRRWERPHPSPLVTVPESLLANAEEQAVENAELARTMATLHPRHAQVLLLGASGHSRDEIAKILGISPAAVGMLLQRARRAAREHWAKVVAALTLIGMRGRKWQQAPSDSVSALAASVVTASIAAALVLPATGGSANTGTASRSIALTASTRMIEESRPSASLPTSMHDLAAASSSNSGRRLPGMRIVAPERPNGYCVGPTDVRFCPPVATQRGGGDSICFKRTGNPCVPAQESVTPVCRDVVDNPVVNCKHDGDTDWTVDPSRHVPPIGQSR